MNRLDQLKEDLATIKSLRTLSYDLKDACLKYYATEINAIEVYGSWNPEDEPSEISKETP